MTKEAMQQALKALTNCTDYDNQGDPLEGKDVVNDLAIEALIEALKQEQGDPVATLIEHYAFTDGIVRFDGVENMEQLPVGTKLYTTPQTKEWVSLTNEQIVDLVIKNAGFPTKLAEAIEAKLKEKNA